MKEKKKIEKKKILTAGESYVGQYISSSFRERNSWFWGIYVNNRRKIYARRLNTTLKGIVKAELRNTLESF